MPIVGITETSDGQPIQRLAVDGKIAIGRVVKKGDKEYPKKLDHFIFLRKGGNDFEWQEDAVLNKTYMKDGQPCRAVPIVLLSDTIEQIFPTKLAWWTKTQCKCSGDGVTAIRRTEQNPQGEPWTPCGNACPDLRDGRCKPWAQLYFTLADMPKLGCAWKFQTSSYRSVRQIYSSLVQMQNMIGRLSGVRALLVVRPERMTYDCDFRKANCPQGPHKHTTTAYVVSLELQGRGFEELAQRMAAPALAFDRVRKLLGGATVQIEDAPETILAGEVQPEFHPSAEAEAMAVEAEAMERPSTPPPENLAPEVTGTITQKQWESFKQLAYNNGWRPEEILNFLKKNGWKAASEIPAKYLDWLMRTAQLGEANAGPKDAEPAAVEITDEDVPF